MLLCCIDPSLTPNPTVLRRVPPPPPVADPSKKNRLRPSDDAMHWRLRRRTRPGRFARRRRAGLRARLMRFRSIRGLNQKPTRSW